MNVDELKHFGGKLEKNAIFKALRVMGKRFLGKGGRKAVKDRLDIGKNFGVTMGVAGGLGVGGVAYGAVSQPRSIMSKAPGRFTY